MAELEKAIKWEKAIKGLECCTNSDMSMCLDKCPYHTDGCSGGIKMMRDALSLLKAQEVPDTNAGKWTTERTQEHDGEWYCSKCGYEPVVMSDDMKYCPGCGRKMITPEPPKEEPC